MSDKAIVILTILFTMLLAGCSSIPTSKPISPDVNLANVSLTRLGLEQQEFAFTLEVFNPNSYDLPIQSLDFTVYSDDELVVSADHNENILLPAKSSTQATVNIETRLNRLLKQLLVLATSNDTSLDYTITGNVKLANWPVRIPFNAVKSLENPLAKPQ